ncbi:hypothetical protein, partial [Baaleninema sp.]|uniref:hypothetical protein n=1 Tax=Baaleninema sp. TaxID=3101197 RepID=UPI003CFF05FD
GDRVHGQFRLLAAIPISLFILTLTVEERAIGFGSDFRVRLQLRGIVWGKCGAIELSLYLPRSTRFPES